MDLPEVTDTDNIIKIIMIIVNYLIYHESNNEFIANMIKIFP